MNITGIIVEYNPFHNGHIRHIKQARKITKCDLLIAVTSGNFSQRGDISIINKFEKTKAALENNVDLVVELPYIYTTQNALVFGQKAVEILHHLSCNNIVFGSETCNMEELQKYAGLNININYLKEIMSDGTSFPKAYGLLASSLYPNDILAVSYLKAIKSTNIQPFCIQRNTNYHSNKLKKICSAKAIREAILQKKDYSIATPIKIKEAHFNKELYPFLQNLLATRKRSELEKIFLVSEGIENMLIKNAAKYDDFEDFINHSVSKRYTRSRIQRVLLQIMMNITKEDVSNLSKMNYIRILGFNKKGQAFLKQFDNENIQLVTQFKNIPQDYKDIEWKASRIYSSLLKKKGKYLIEELKGPIIYKD